MCSQVCHKSTNCACVQVLFRTLLVPPLHRCATRRAISKSGPSLFSFVICMSAVELWFGLKRISVFKQSKTLFFLSFFFFFTITRCLLLFLHNHTASFREINSSGQATPLSVRSFDNNTQRSAEVGRDGDLIVRP